MAEKRSVLISYTAKRIEISCASALVATLFDEAKTEWDASDARFELRDILQHQLRNAYSVNNMIGFGLGKFHPKALGTTQTTNGP